MKKYTMGWSFPSEPQPYRVFLYPWFSSLRLLTSPQLVSKTGVLN